MKKGGMESFLMILTPNSGHSALSESIPLSKLKLKLNPKFDMSIKIYQQSYIEHSNNYIDLTVVVFRSLGSSKMFK